MNDLWRAFSEGGFGQLSAELVLFYLLLAFLMSQLVAWVYVRTHSGVSYSRSQVQSLVLISLIVAAVMLAIGNNLARAFGLFGALALIRFRTPVKDTRDTVFLFMSVGIGIATGSQNPQLAVLSTLAFCAIAFYLHWTRFGSRIAHNAVLRFRMADGEDEAPLRQVLRRYCNRVSLMHLQEVGTGGPVELAYEVYLLAPEYSRSLVAEMRQVAGVGDVSLHLQDEDVEI